MKRTKACYPCAEKCQCAGDERVYCVDCKKVFCSRCVGRIHHEECGSAGHIIEEIDGDHANTHLITCKIIDGLVLVAFAYCIMSSSVGDDYFAGSAACPVTAKGRSWLAHYDMNVFYYFKEQFALYCDVEDSFWRLIMDGWVRGVATGSDSLLLLAATLPKAFAFKIFSVTLVQPVLTVCLAALGFLLNYVVYAGEAGANSLQKSWEDNVVVPFITPASGALGQVTTSKFAQYFNYVFWLPMKAWTFFQQKRGPYSKNVSFWMKVLTYCGIFRVIVRLLITEYAPSFFSALLASSGTSVGQLMMEPIVFWNIHYFALWTNKKLDGLFPAGKGSPPGEPLTLWRKMPHTDYYERFAYFQARLKRTFGIYKKEAEVIGLYVDDIFNLVVIARILLIVLAPLGISEMLRTAIALIPGLGSLAAYHATWFQKSTGFMPTDTYWSDWALGIFGGRGYWALDQTRKVADDFVILPAHEYGILAWEMGWRAVLPLVCYFVQRKIDAEIAKQKGKHQEIWKEGIAMKPATFATEKENYKLWLKERVVERKNLLAEKPNGVLGYCDWMKSYGSRWKCDYVVPVQSDPSKGIST